MSDDLTIDGVTPDRVERPSDPGEIAELLGEASVTGGWVLPVGGGTAMRGLNPVDTVPIALDLTGLAGTAEYTPADMTVSVRAGTRWGDLQEALAEHGQTLPIDVPFLDRATVGGVVATGYAGPRRLRDGTLKDLLLGASYVRGDGLAAKAGGMVVKNVSGFEIPRLLHGSWGSLAAIVSVNLKVLPAPEHELTLHVDEADAVALAERLLALTRSRPAVASAVIDGTLEVASGAVRLTGRAAPTAALAAETRTDDGIAWAETIDDAAASAGWWQAREDRLASVEDTTVAVEIGCAPSALVEVLGTLRAAFPNPAGVALHASPGVGAIALAFPADAISLATWARLWTEHGLDQHARFVVVAAPRAWRAERDVWFIEPAARRLMQALKTSFDPNDTLNRGRLWTAPAATLA
jgi:glycolate oxidase FAD binding subunit